jgi:DhnA family fructose-bisphosphate aldolase class Ia
VRNVPILASDGRALIVAMDHARTHGAIEGLEDPGAVIEASVDGGADAVMTTFGVAKRYREQLAGRIPTIICLDGGPRMETAGETLQVVQNATEAGAAGVVFGRNIWQSGDTRGMIRALNSLIHEGRPVAEALSESDLA